MFSRSCTHGLSPLELKWRSLEVGGRVVFAPGDDPVRPRRPKVARVDGPGLAGDVTVAGASVSQKDVAKLLPALAHADHPLVVGRPRQVIDGPADGLVLVFEDVLGVHGVPDPHLNKL
jgi:hypothetical protein